MKKLLRNNSLILLFIGTCHFCWSQTKHGNQWLIGSMQNVLDFNSAPTQLDTSLNYSVPFMAQGKSNICDSSGQLLMFCNGMRLFNASGNLIESGDTLVPLAYYNYYFSVSIVSQSSIILPVDSDQYYLFTPVPTDSNFNANWVTNVDAYFDELWYHRIDMRANGGAGKVMKKKVPILQHVKLSQSQMMACRHANGKDWWLVKMAIDSHKAYVFYVGHDTVFLQHTIIFPFAKIRKELHGQSSFDASGEHFATVSNNFTGEFFYGDFDRCTGMLSSMKRAVAPHKPFNATIDSSITGLCLSPNGQLIYVIKKSHVLQFRISDSTFYTVSGPDTTDIAFQGYKDGAVAPDGKLYLGTYGIIYKSMSVIDNPNGLYSTCNFCRRCLRSEASLGTLGVPPCMPDFALGPLTPCWPNAIDDMKYEPEYRIYPNPVQEQLNIEWQASDLRFVELRDIGGQILAQQTVEPGSHHIEIDMSGYASGIYLIQLKNNLGAVYMKKVIK
jgi:hypothetical protein